MADEMKLPDEDDFTHYFNATGRLSKENAALRAEVESLRGELAAARERAAYAFHEEQQAKKARDAAVKKAEERIDCRRGPGWSSEEPPCGACSTCLTRALDAALSRAEAAEQIAREACGWPGRESPPSDRTWVEELAGFLRVTRGQRDSNRELLIDAEARLRDVQEALRSVEESCRVALHRLG